jgi:hypothetical protein
MREFSVFRRKNMKNVSRRHYLHSLFADAMDLVDELRGKPQFRLDELASLPDAALRAMAPVVSREITLGIEDDWLLLQESPDAPFKRHMPLTAQQIYILNCFDGQHSIADICGVMESEFALSPAAAADVVRTLFVTLAQKGLCHPVARPE